ncbi:hypothetical protein BC940DRAFT_312641 [Gongronella butleri]|nr:hypothetical protein BC940DRAFT_312641 [Gongronella butleri]
MAYSAMSWEKYLSAQEAVVYGQLFKAVSNVTSGIVTGTEAVQFFAKSGVPNQILSDIWETADRDNLGYLTPETFSIALKLIACAQHGTEVADPIISTSVPLPQFKGMSLDTVSSPRPNAPAAAAAVASAPAAMITATEREKYAAIFRAQQPKNGVLDANAAKSVFLKSRLPNDTLAEIWGLADVRQSGTLNQTEFTIAMHYIAKMMDGSMSSLPAQLPVSVYSSAGGGGSVSTPLLSHQASPLAPQLTGNSTGSFHRIMTPPQRAATIDSLGSFAFSTEPPQQQQTPQTSQAQQPQQKWDVPASEKTQYDSYFDRIDTQRIGFVQGKDAVEFFKNSGLADADLAHIWDLADTAQRGRLSRDEFAVAMHLIHKRLRGETLPTVLPPSLMPPSHQASSPAAFVASPRAMPLTSPAFASAMPTQDPFNPPSKEGNLLEDDLLGDFGNNDALPRETNQVNQLHNQISALQSTTMDVKKQKATAEQTLEQLGKQKAELQTALTQVQMAHDAEVKELNALQETIRQEEPAWQQARSEYDAAQQQLQAARQEIQQLKQRIESSREQSEQYRQQVVAIQQETQQLLQQVEQLTGEAKQQETKTDIHHRQVTAAAQDRDQAKRHMEDAKEVQGMTQALANDVHIGETNAAPSNPPNLSTPIATHGDGDDGETSSDDDEPFDRKKYAAAAAASPKSPTSPKVPSNSNSPFATHSTTEPKNSFFDIFSPHLSQAESPAGTPKQETTAPAANAAAPDDFDAVFGDLAGVPSPDEQANDEQTTKNVVHDPFAAFGASAAAPTQPAATSSSPSAFDDDFDAAFSGSLSAAKVATVSSPVQGNAKNTDIDDIDAAFGLFDQKTVPKEAPTAWASSFDGFNAGASGSGSGHAPAAAAAPADDWDAIFGAAASAAPAAAAPAATTSAPAESSSTASFGFDDAFSTSAVASTSAPAATTTPDAASRAAKASESDKLEELVRMGFDRTMAKDALNRYDQDVTKATNFLLDQPAQ